MEELSKRNEYLETICIFNVILQSILHGRLNSSLCSFGYTDVDESSHSIIMDLIGDDKVVERITADVGPGTFFIVTLPMNGKMKDAPFDLVHSNGNKKPFYSHCEVVYRDAKGMRYEAFLFHVADGDMTNDGMYQLLSVNECA